MLSFIQVVELYAVNNRGLYIIPACLFVLHQPFIVLHFQLSASALCHYLFSLVSLSSFPILSQGRLFDENYFTCPLKHMTHSMFVISYLPAGCHVIILLLNTYLLVCYRTVVVALVPHIVIKNISDIIANLLENIQILI